MENPSYYGIMPANIRYDKNLKPMEKIMYVEITALSNKNGYCNATNSYFAELYDVWKNTVSLWISNLEKAGYIKIVFMYEEGTKNIKERRLYVNDTPIMKNHNTCYEKEEYPVMKNHKPPVMKNHKDNNTSNNNTSINNNNTLSNQDIKNKSGNQNIKNNNRNSFPYHEGILFQEIKMILGGNGELAKRIIKLNKPISRIKEVVTFCNLHEKGDGWLYLALKEDWKLVAPKEKEIDPDSIEAYFLYQQKPKRTGIEFIDPKIYPWGDLEC